MGFYVNPTNAMFQETLNAKFYVDKTGIAAFLNERLSTPEKFVCVSRPRRFGKSVDADMLVAYYTRGADSRAQFAGLDVERDQSFERHLNAHENKGVGGKCSIGGGAQFGTRKAPPLLQCTISHTYKDASIYVHICP